MPHLHTVRYRLEMAAIFVALLLPLRGRAQTLITSDSLLNTGTPVTVTYNAPGTSGPTGTVHPTSDGSKSLWLMYPNPWGVSSGSGTIDMNYSGSGSITTTISLSGIPTGAVVGYPFILYGCDPYYGSDHTCYQDQPPQFPKQLSAMSSLVVDVSYALTGTISGSVGVDLLFDQWICKTNQPLDTADCLELIIVPYDSIDTAGWTKIGTNNVAATINGTPGTLEFDDYYWGTGNLLIAPHSLPGASSQTIRFDLLTIMNKGVSDYGAHFNDYSFSWLMGIELGSEFGGNSSQSYTLTINKLDLEQTLAGGAPAAPTNLTAVVK
jgi:hypothetical protein